MSYSGTVRCGYCYQKGHNKRSCGDYSSALQRIYKRSKQDGDMERAKEYGEIYTKRTGCDPDTGATIAKTKEQKKQAKAARMQNITCSYCTKRGHTRRTCETLKTDKKVYVKATQIQREQVLEELRSLGAGVGSMARMLRYGYHGKNREWGSKERAMVLKEIRWDVILPHAEHLQSLHFVDVAALMGNDNDPYSSTTCAMDSIRTHAANGTLSPVNNVSPPKGWLTAASVDFSRYFPPSQSRPWAMEAAAKYDSSVNRYFAEAREQLGLSSES